jgi:LemA protein
VQNYNIALRTFPTVIWAKTFYSGQKPAVPFNATEGAQTAPKVSFPGSTP